MPRYDVTSSTLHLAAGRSSQAHCALVRGTAPAMGESMRRWVSMIGSMLLVLMLWTGATAHAAETTECSPATLESPIHLDSSKDSPSDERESRAVHVHFGCGGHCLATRVEEAPDLAGSTAIVAVFGGQAFGLAGDGPALTLRPPIA